MRDGSMPTRPAPTRLRVWWLNGSVRVAEVAARWRSGGRRPASWARARPQVKRARPAWLSGSSGSSAQPRWPIRPTTRTAPARSARRARRHSPGQSSGAAPSRAMPVSSWRWIRRADAGADDRLQVVAAGDGQVDAVGDRGTEVGVEGVQPAQGRRLEAGPPQRQTLVDAGHAEPRSAVGQRRPGHLGRAVAEAVRLHHGHQRARRTGGEQAGVGGDGALVDVEARSVTQPRLGVRHRAHAARSVATGP